MELNRLFDINMNLQNEIYSFLLLPEKLRLTQFNIKLRTIFPHIKIYKSILEMQGIHNDKVNTAFSSKNIFYISAILNRFISLDKMIILKAIIDCLYYYIYLAGDCTINLNYLLWKDIKLLSSLSSLLNKEKVIYNFAHISFNDVKLELDHAYIFHNIKYIKNLSFNEKLLNMILLNNLNVEIDNLILTSLDNKNKLSEFGESKLMKIKSIIYDLDPLFNDIGNCEKYLNLNKESLNNITFRRDGQIKDYKQVLSNIKNVNISFERLNETDIGSFSDIIIDNNLKIKKWSSISIQSIIYINKSASLFNNLEELILEVDPNNIEIFLEFFKKLNKISLKILKLLSLKEISIHYIKDLIYLISEYKMLNVLSLSLRSNCQICTIFEIDKILLLRIPSELVEEIFELKILDIIKANNIKNNDIYYKRRYFEMFADNCLNENTYNKFFLTFEDQLIKNSFGLKLGINNYNFSNVNLYNKISVLKAKNLKSCSFLLDKLSFLNSLFLSDVNKTDKDLFSKLSNVTISNITVEIICCPEFIDYIINDFKFNRQLVSLDIQQNNVIDFGKIRNLELMLSFPLFYYFKVNAKKVNCEIAEKIKLQKIQGFKLY